MSAEENLAPRLHIIRAQIFLFVKGMLRRMTIGARGMVIDDGKVLLLRHTYIRGWQLPGGGIDPGETAESAFRREVLEETGYRVTGSAQLFAVYHNVQATNRDHVLLYTARDCEKAYEFAPNHEVSEIGWFDHDQLPEDTTPATRKRIAEVFGGSLPDPKW